MLARFYSTSHLDVARKNLLDHNRFILTKILRSVRASHSHRNNFIPTLFVSFFPSANLSRLRSPDTGIKVKYVSSRSPYHRHDDIVTLNVNVNVKQITRLHDEVSFMLYRCLPPHAHTRFCRQCYKAFRQADAGARWARTQHTQKVLKFYVHLHINF